MQIIHKGFMEPHWGSDLTYHTMDIEASKNGCKSTHSVYLHIGTSDTSKVLLQ